MKQQRKSLFAIGSAIAATVLSMGIANADNMRVSGLGSYGGLNMRAGPGTGFSIVATMPRGANYINWTCNRRTRGNSTWYEIDWNGVSGWASARYLSYMPGSHRHCNGHVDHGSGSGSGGSGSGHGHTHTTHNHSHSHGGYSHSHPHTHNGTNGHNVRGHGGRGHTVSTPSVPQCVTRQIGALTLKVCP